MNFFLGKPEFDNFGFNRTELNEKCIKGNVEKLSFVISLKKKNNIDKNGHCQISSGWTEYFVL